MSDDSNDRRGEGWPGSSYPRQGAGQRGRQDDPLAELARLIDEDPFADFDRRRGAPEAPDQPRQAAQAGQDHDSTEIAEDTHHDASSRPGEEYPPQPYDDEPYSAGYAGDVDHDKLFADLSDEAPHEERLDDDDLFAAPAADPLASAPGNPVGSRPGIPEGYDPAAELEAELFAARHAPVESPDDDLKTDEERISYSDPVDDSGWQSRFERRTASPGASVAAGAGTVAAGAALGAVTAHGVSAGTSHPRPYTSVASPAAPAPIAEAPATPTTADPHTWDESSWDEVEQGHAGRPQAHDAVDAAEQYQTEPAYSESDPVYEDDGYMPPYAEEGARSRRGLTVVLALAGLVVVGGVVAFAYRGFFGEAGGPPPVIRAEPGPTKTVPEGQVAEDADGQSKIVFDRVAGQSTEREERIVSREEPVFDVEGRERQIRVIETNQEEVGLRGGAQDGASSAASADQPRRVRTVVVRPDGTIVENPAPVDTALRASENASPPSPPPSQALETSSANEAPASTNGAQSPVQNDALAEIASPSSNAVATNPTATPAPAQQQAGQPLQLGPAASSPSPAPDPFQATQQPPQQQQVAQAPTPAAPATPPSDVQQARFPAGSYVVQVGSTRSEGEARTAASSIQQRYSNLLTGYEPAVERADLGERGIFYRIAVGPLGAQADATSLCEQLKSAGLDCFVRRN